MKTFSSFFTLVISTLLLAPVAHSADELWSTEGFSNPESALYDSARDIIYVSNVDGAPTDKDGAGHISLLTKDGKMHEANWVTGLNAPNLHYAQGDRLILVLAYKHRVW